MKYITFINIGKSIVLGFAIYGLYLMLFNTTPTNPQNSIVNQLDTIINKQAYQTQIDSLGKAYDNLKVQQIENNAYWTNRLRHADSLEAYYRKNKIKLPKL